MEWSAYSAPSSDGNISNDPGLTIETEEEKIHRAFSFVCSLIMLMLCCLGSTGNLLSISIFTRTSMRSSINILLVGLSGVDFSILIVSIVVFVVPGLNSYGHLGQLKILQILIIRCFYQTGAIAQTCSVWTFVLISIERFLAICYPFRAHRHLTTKRAKLAQISLLIFAVGYNLIRFWEYSLVYEEKSINQSESSSASSFWPIGYKKYLRDNYSYFISYYTLSYIIIHFAIPFPLITFLNLHILKAISAAGTARCSMTQGTRIDADQRQQRQIARMIIVVTVIFAICNICPLILNVWEALKPTLFTDEESRIERMVAYFMLDISNLLVCGNSSINCIIYIIYCQQYKRICMEYFRGIFCRENRKRKTAVEEEEADVMLTELDDCNSNGRLAVRIKVIRAKSWNGL